MPRSTCTDRRRRGQAVSFVLMALVILFFVFLWSADLHRVIAAKDDSQNAGDAAALAAARWQASSLNLMGELTLLHALALAAGDEAAVSLVTNTQARLCYTGPMTAACAAQQAAMLNGIPANDDFATFVRMRAAIVRKGYAATFGGAGSVFEEPYPGAWDEYAAMLDALADGGIAAGPDNAVFYTDVTGGHTLLDKGFYRAVAGQTWCWFHLHNPKLLEDYTGPSWWPPLPVLFRPNFANSEIFSLRLAPSWRALRSFGSERELEALADEAGHPLPLAGGMSNAWHRADQLWYVYDGPQWGHWDALDAPFPVTGKVRPEYDYEGADAVVRIETTLERFSPEATGASGDAIVWTAAGKPFGYLDAEGRRIPPNTYGLVLPAFRDIRLMPVDASTGGSGGSFDLRWREHLALHLFPYLKDGTSALHAGCYYCRQLVRWEDSEFRRKGVEWLKKNSGRCTVTPGGHGGDHGGSAHGH